MCIYTSKIKIYSLGCNTPSRNGSQDLLLGVAAVQYIATNHTNDIPTIICNDLLTLCKYIQINTNIIIKTLWECTFLTCFITSFILDIMLPCVWIYDIYIYTCIYPTYIPVQIEELAVDSVNTPAVMAHSVWSVAPPCKLPRNLAGDIKQYLFSAYYAYGGVLK